MIRVFVVEDQRALADALEIAIGTQPDMECAGASGTLEEAMRCMETQCPDVVLMDIHLPGTDGITGTELIRTAHPSVRVLILTGDVSAELFDRANAVGAAWFLTKDSALADILAAIRTPAGQEIKVGGGTLMTLLRRPRPGEARAGLAENWAGLTEREHEVLALMGEGLDPRAIAERLVMSPHTARGHVKHIMAKLGVHTQLNAVVVAIRTGVLPGPPNR